MSEEFKSYSAYYGIRQNTPISVMVCHLRSVHRVKLGTDYWLKTNDRGIIVRPVYEAVIREHIAIYVDDEKFTVQVKDKPGRNQKVYKFQQENNQ